MTKKIYPDSIIKFGDENEKVKNSQTFKFLGSMVNFKEIGTGNTELNNGINSVQGKFKEYRRILTNYNLKLEWPVTLALSGQGCFIRLANVALNSISIR